MTEEGTFTTKIPKLPVTLVFYWVKAVTMQYGEHLPRQMTHALHKILLPKTQTNQSSSLSSAVCSGGRGQWLWFHINKERNPFPEEKR